MKISLIIPCYNEEESIPLLYEELCRVSNEMSDYDFEYLFVDDGSKDKTLEILINLAKSDERIKYVSFSRNFGKEAAMYAGFCNITGDYCAVMDADLQHPPRLLHEMVSILEKGEYDSVAARRNTRKGENKFRSFFSKCFYKVINAISDTDVGDSACDYRLMKREMVDSIVSMCESNRFSKGIFGWIGFKTYWLPFDNVERVAGKTKWNFWKLLKYSVDGIFNFSNAPIKITSLSGIFLTFISLVMLIFVFMRALIYGDPVAGWPSTICIILFMGGIQLFSLGIIGQYISKIYIETKRRPHYIVAKTNKNDIVRK